jgi:hypothetical protein
MNNKRKMKKKKRKSLLYSLSPPPPYRPTLIPSSPVRKEGRKEEATW